MTPLSGVAFEELKDALNLYQRIALSLTRSTRRLGAMTLLPSERVTARLAVLVDVGLVQIADDDALTLPDPRPLLSRYGFTVAWVQWAAMLQHMWEQWRPPLEDGSLLHGPVGFWEHWWAVLNDWGPETFVMDVVLPASPRFTSRNWLEYIDRELYQELVGSGRMRQRVIVPASTAADEAADLVDLVLTHGQEVRALDVPDWFASYGTRTVVVPEQPGDVWDGYCRRITNPLVGQVYHRKFEMLWARAQQLGAGVRPHTQAETVLALMAAGLTDTQIADRLGVSERTVARRLADEMLRAGVVTRFQMGMEYQKGR